LPEKAGGSQARSALHELALVLVRLDHVASVIVTRITASERLRNFA